MPKGKSKKQEAPSPARAGQPVETILPAGSSPPASQPPEAPPPPELESVWQERVAAQFADLRPQQQKFLLVYLREGIASEAYRQAYNLNATPHVASVCGSQLLASPGISAILALFTDRKTEAMFLVSETYFGMVRATQPAMVQDPTTKEWKDVGKLPDWRTRGAGAAGLERIYGLQPEPKKPFNPLGQEGAIPAPFAVQFNVYAQQMGLPTIALPAPVVEEAEATPAAPAKKPRKTKGHISDFGKDFQEFAGG